MVHLRLCQSLANCRLLDIYIIALNPGITQKMIETTNSHATADLFKGSSGPRRR
jgi:hypothetical protein